VPTGRGLTNAAAGMCWVQRTTEWVHLKTKESDSHRPNYFEFLNHTKRETQFPKLITFEGGLLLGIPAPGATKPSDANVYNKDGWICYIGVLRRKLWRERKQNGKCKLEGKEWKDSSLFSCQQMIKGPSGTGFTKNAILVKPFVMLLC
jgi:hypothetical protein